MIQSPNACSRLAARGSRLAPCGLLLVACALPLAVRRSILAGSGLLLVLAVACGPALTAPTAPPAVPSPTPSLPQLRVKNAGAVPIQGLVILFPEDRVEFDDIAPGATTDYRDVPHGVYRYAAYHLVVDGEGVDLPVIDWMGEEPVPGQAFTYVLDLDPARGKYEMLQLVAATVDR